MRPSFGGSLLAAVLSFHAVEARAGDAGASQQPAARVELDELPPWSLRLSMAGGVALPSLHEEILAAEGYGGPRWALTLAVERRLSGHFGLGGLVRYQFRSLEPSERGGATELERPGPSYSEAAATAGLDLPVTFLISRRAGGHATELCLVPWVGAGAGTLDLHGNSEWRAGPALGGEVRLLWRGPRLVGGFTAGAYSLRIAQPSSIEGPLELGMILLSLMGGLDVG